PPFPYTTLFRSQAVIQQAGVDALVAPVLRGGSAEGVTVTLIYFEARGGEMKGVTRTLPGPNVTQAVLDAVPAMVREAFGLPEPLADGPAEPSEAPPVASPQDDAEATDRGARRLQVVVPIVLGAV